MTVLAFLDTPDCCDFLNKLAADFSWRSIHSAYTLIVILANQFVTIMTDKLDRFFVKYLTNYCWQVSSLPSCQIFDENNLVSIKQNY